MASRRLLMVCYYFPPVASVGSVRVGALAKYLPHHGWEATVLTPRRPGLRPPGVEVLETADADRAARVKRVLGLTPELALRDQVGAAGRPGAPGAAWRARLIEIGKALLAFPDAHRGWVPLAVRGAREAGAARRFDAVLTSSPPVSVHLAGRRIARALELPWVADLRDLWSQDHNSTAPPWRRRLEGWLERRTLRDADALVTVSDPLALELGALHPGRPTHVILNGFDPELAGLAAPRGESFTLCHTGTFYQGRRDPTPLLRVLASLLAAGRIDRRRVRLRLLSRREPWLREAIARHGLEDVVVLEPWVPWEEALRAQQEAQVLVLLHWGGPAERGVYTGKVFEYLAARRPILMIGGGEGVLADLLRETGAGVHVRDDRALERQLLAWWEEYASSGRVAYRGDDRRLERYSHRRMAGEFARILGSVREPRAAGAADAAFRDGH